MLPSKRNFLRFFGALDARGLAPQHDGRLLSWPLPSPRKSAPPPEEDPRWGEGSPWGEDGRAFTRSDPEATELPFERLEFYVWAESGEPIGPVSVDQIARGILAGRVPLQAYVMRSGDPEWRKVLERREIVRALELSSSVETIDVIDDEEELVEIFDDVDDLGEAIEQATNIYEASALGAEHDDGSEAGTGQFQASGGEALLALDAIEEDLDAEAEEDPEPEAEAEEDPEPEEDPEAEAGTNRYVATDAATAEAILAAAPPSPDDLPEELAVHHGHEGPVATALANALSKAAEHGRWDVVLELARQLEARRPGPPAPDSTIFFPKPSS